VATAVAAGFRHSCALIGTGGAKCWGRNREGELGNGTTKSHLTAVDVSRVRGGMASIDVGDAHSCVLTRAGGVACWGDDHFGELGDGSTSSVRLTPVVPVGLNVRVVAIAVGDFHSCALTSAGGVKCWGWNYRGQLGDGTTTMRSRPVDVVGLGSGVTAVAAGYRHSCALMSTGGAKCWGRNLEGQLGDGTTTSRLTPVDVLGLGSSATAIAAGDFHSCALTSTTRVRCWGFNGAGELGDGTMNSSMTPVEVSGLSGDVIAIAAGDFHNCALTSSGGVKCWGLNDHGQLGDGTTVSRSTPVDVVGLRSGVTAIAAGGFHTCALTRTGVVKCWGSNLAGELGDGTRRDRLTPARVVGVNSSHSLR
jgi:alpha-tubulin suppressor-like RCC1 family protein